MNEWPDVAFRAGAGVYRRIRDFAGRSFWGHAYAERVSSRSYRRNVWADPESRSGRSSTVATTATIRRDLPELLVHLGARSLLDAPCGDLNWIRHVELPIGRYIGTDIVADLVERNKATLAGSSREFAMMDATRDPVPKADVILCRDCLIHLPNSSIHAAIANFKRSGSTYLLTTTNTTATENRNSGTGDCFLLNLEQSPFDLPPPSRTLQESEVHGRSLGLWRIADL